MKSLAGFVLALTIVVWHPPLAAAAGVRPLFDLSEPSGAPFPSDRFTVRDPNHVTGLRVNLPKPDCTVQKSDCEDIDLVNELDGFNIRVRLSIPFSGPIDVTTVSSETVFLVSLGSTLPHHRGDARVVGIDQIVWDVATNTLYVSPAEQLDQHTRYALVVTCGILDTSGKPIERADEFRDFHSEPNFGVIRDPALIHYVPTLMSGVAGVLAAHVVAPRDIAAVSVFTTKSVTAIFEKLRDHVRAGATPPDSDFQLGRDESRTVFALDDIKTATFNRHDRAGDTSPLSALSLDSRLALLRLFPGAVGHLAFGKYQSPNYLAPGGHMPPFGTATGTPHLQGTNDIYFTLFLPSDTPRTPRPVNGWPVVIFMPGSPDNKQGGPFNVAATFAAHGMASISINATGLGFGPRSTVTVVPKSGSAITFLAGGRSLDQNGDGLIGAGEGIQVEAPRRTLRNAHTTRQTVVDLIQLVRVIESGIDVDGDGVADLDAARMYYAGFSAGPNFGTPLFAVEPRLRAAALTAPAAGLEYGRLSPANRGGFGSLLAARVPPLVNADDGLTTVGGVPVQPPFFNENLPQDGEPPVVNNVPGAIVIQEVIERAEWVGGSPAAFAPYLRRSPLPGVPARPLLIQLSKGDQTIPTPSTAAMLRAGDLADTATLYRHDRGHAADPTRMKDPHTFLIRSDTANMRSIALAGQRQIAVFLASDGVDIVDPDEPGADLFEVPISRESLEDLTDLAYIP